MGNRQGYYAREVLRGVLSVQSECSDWDIWIVPMIHEKRQLRDLLGERKVVGVIARGIGEDLISLLKEEGVPLVVVRGLEASSDGGENALHVDDKAIGKRAGEEFVNLNLDYWGFVHWERVAWSEERRKSFHAYASSRGASNSTLTLASKERRSWDGVLKISRWLTKLSKPCGVLACNDEAGLDVLHACQTAGLSVPDQVAVIGVDNDHLLCSSTVPQLSSIDLHAVEVGRSAVKQLMTLLACGEKIGQTVHAGQATMVVRESSHAIDRYLLRYQKAMDYINARPLAELSVIEVAAACGVSRRGLERAFEQHSGESPAGVIRKRRLTGILKLLKNQSTSLDKVAQQAGFSDTAGLSNFVKRMTGKPPGAFR